MNMNSPAAAAANYRLYVSDVSYYSGKLEAFLRYKGIAHERIVISERILREVVLPATGFMKVPAMECADGRWLKDTTPMMQWLDRQHPQFPIYPDDPATRFLALVVEDYADEWMWRPAMYYRWKFPDSHRLLRARLGRELSHGTPHSAWLLGWWFRWRQYLIFVRGDGVRGHNQRAVEALYHRTLKQLTALLETQPFLGGAQPGIVDFAFFASMFRHFALDPHSAKIMVDTAPAVFAWVARVWNARGERDGNAAFDDFSSDHWVDLFESIATEYLPYLDRNAEAFARGDKRFDLVVRDPAQGSATGAAAGTTYPRMPVVRYRVACREMLLKEHAALDANAKSRVRARAPAIARWLESAVAVDSGLAEEFEMPLKRRYPPARGWYGIKLRRGTPWDLPAPPIDR